jgi:hypothetical protein
LTDSFRWLSDLADFSDFSDLADSLFPRIANANVYGLIGEWWPSVYLGPAVTVVVVTAVLGVHVQAVWPRPLAGVHHVGLHRHRK